MDEKEKWYSFLDLGNYFLQKGVKGMSYQSLRFAWEDGLLEDAKMVKVHGKKKTRCLPRKAVVELLDKLGGELSIDDIKHLQPYYREGSAVPLLMKE